MKGFAIYPALVMPALVVRDLDPDADQLVISNVILKLKGQFPMN